MKKLFTLISIALFSFSSSAQNWLWAKTVAYPATYNSDNILAAGGLGSFYSGATNSSGCVLIKFDGSGTELWRKTIPGMVQLSGIVNYGTNVYAVGTFSGSMTVDASSIASAGNYDVFLLALNTSGTVLWLKSFGGGGPDYGSGITADANGKVYITGTHGSSAMFGTQSASCACSSSMYMAEVNSSGIVGYVKSSGCIYGPGSFAQGRKIAVDSKKNKYIFGTYSYFSIDTFQVSGGGGPYDTWFITKIDSNNTVKWAKPTPNYQVLSLSNIALDSSEYVLVTGYHVWTNGGTTVTYKFDPANGAVLYDKHSGGFCYGDQGMFWGVAAQGNNAFTVGNLRLGANCPPSRSKLLLIKYNSIGAEIIHDTLETTTSPGDFNIIKDSYGDYVICGTLQTGTLALGSTTLNATSGFTVFIAKFTEKAISTGIALNNTYSNKFEIYPNPSSGMLTIEPGNVAIPFSLKVYDCLGNCIVAKNNNNTSQVSLDLTSRAKGLYFVEIGSGEKRELRKVVLE